MLESGDWRYNQGVSVANLDSVRSAQPEMMGMVKAELLKGVRGGHTQTDMEGIVNYVCDVFNLLLAHGKGTQERRLPMMYTLHLGQQLKYSRNAKEQPRLAAALLRAVTQLKVAGYFKYLKFVCLHHPSPQL